MMRATWMMTMAGMERAHTDSAMHPEYCFLRLPRNEGMELVAAAAAHVL